MKIPSIHPEQERHSSLLKAGGCMGRLEDIAIWFSIRQDQPVPELLRPTLVLFAADHGVAAAMGYGEKTNDELRKNAAEGSAIRILCQQAGAGLHIVDVGVDDGLVDVDDIEHAKVRSTGSADIRKTAAMDQMDYWECVGIGEEMANRAINDGSNLLIASSISCGDNIAIAAILAELAGLSPEAALLSTADPAIYTQELMAVEQALARAQGTPSHDILREIGGLEFASMAGFYRAAATRGVPVLLDGRASVAAALATIAWDVCIAGWMLASHVSDDTGHREALESLGLEPMMELKSGIEKGKVAALLLPLLQSAINFQQGLTTIEA